MTERFTTPGFDNINDFIPARGTGNSWFKSMIKALRNKLPRSNEAKPNLETESGGNAG